MTGIESLPPLAPGAIPASVRDRGPEAVRSFRAGLGFERLLLSELLAAAVPEPSGEEDGAPADPRLGMLPEALADAIVAGGGIGLAAQIAAADGEAAP